MLKLVGRYMICAKGPAYGRNSIFVEFGKRRKVEEVVRVQRSTRVVTMGAIGIKIRRRVGMHGGGTRVSSMGTSNVADTRVSANVRYD